MNECLTTLWRWLSCSALGLVLVVVLTDCSGSAGSGNKDGLAGTDMNGPADPGQDRTPEEEDHFSRQPDDVPADTSNQDGRQPETDELVADVSPIVPEPGPVLLLDLEMRNVVSWAFVLSTLEDLGHSTVYRRWYPHVTRADVEPDVETGQPPYQMILVSAGNAPSEPSDRMRPADAENLADYVEAGGTVTLLHRHTWKDGYGGDSDWLIFNRFLESAKSGVRVQKNTAVGFSFVSLDGKPPHHVQGPCAYPGSLEWSIAYPVCYPDDQHPAVAGLEPLAGGVTSTLACETEGASVLAWTHKNILLWEKLEGSYGATEIPLEAQPVAVVAAAGTGSGHVAIIPRSVLQMPAHTEYMSEKPILDFDMLDDTRAFGEALLTHLSAVARDPSEHVPQGCFATTDEGLFSAVGEGLDPLGDGPEQSAMFPPSSAPVPDAPPVVPDGAGLLTEALPEPSNPDRALPAWFQGGKARMGYGGNRPYEEMKAFFGQAVSVGMNSFVVTIDPQWLIDYPGEAPPPFEGIALAAEETGATVLLGVGYLSGLFHDLKEQIGLSAGAYGQLLEAPPPLAEPYWDQYVQPVVLGAARAAKDFPGIAGIHFDMELYGAGALWYMQGYAFDDDTWARIVQALGNVSAELAGQAAPLDLVQRLPWLVDQGLVGFAYNALEDQVAYRAAAIREEARAINPDVELAFYNVVVSTSWFYRGLMRGLGTPDKPVVHLSYDISTDPAREVFENQGIHVLLLGGVLGVRFSPEDLETSLINAGARADGYWLFQFTDFPVQWDPTNPPPMNGTPDAYWSAVEAANAAFDGN